MSFQSGNIASKLRAAITAARLKLSSSASRLTTAITSQSILASVTASTLSAVSSASTLAAQYVKGIFFIFVERSDTASATDDDIVFDIDKNITDTQAVTDLAALNVTRPVTDTASMTDAHSLTPTKGLQDTATSTDGDPAFAVSKGISDIGIVSELFTVDLSKVFSDAVNATDDVNGAAAGDESNLRIFKVITDNGSVAESHVLSPTKGLSDSASTSESGLVFAQDYVDNPQYFASDYVGQSQSF